LVGKKKKKTKNAEASRYAQKQLEGMILWDARTIF
jgi:hypothetical protein